MTPRLEQAVLDVVRQALGESAELTPDTPLRDSGLSSLAATRVWYALRTGLGLDLELAEVGGCRTVADLARLAAGRAAIEPVPADLPPAGETEDGPFPLTDIQQSYLLGARADLTDDPVGCRTYREFVFPDVAADRLVDAWVEVVARHPMLRTVLTDDGQQRITPAESSIDVPRHDATGLDPQALAEHIAAGRERLDRPGPRSVVVELTTLPSGGTLVQLAVDLRVTDGVGLQVILRDWWRSYRGDRLPPLDPALAPQRLLAQLARERSSPAQRRHLDYWAERLAGCPAGPAIAQPRSAGPRRETLSATVEPDQWQRIGALAAEWAVSPTALVLTLFAELFGQGSPAEDFALVLTTNDRSRLPAAVDDVVGPFTSSLVTPMTDTRGLPLREAARAVHERLWEDLQHAAVPGAAALRSARLRAVPALPVVFTSLLGSPAPETAEGFGPAMTTAGSQTSGVTIDAQLWAADGALQLRWDVTPNRLPPGLAQRLFADLVNGLHDLDPATPQTRPLNQLQQAYFVPRATRPPAEWDGCQVYHSFRIRDLDLAALERAWLRLSAAYDVLRTKVEHDGVLTVTPHVPASRCIPVVDLRDGAHDREYTSIRTEFAGRAFPLGRGPQSRLLVTLDADGAATVHLTTDLTVLDGRSIHFVVRELFRLYADPGAVPVAQRSLEDWARDRGAGQTHPDRPRWELHWQHRVDALTGGPALRAVGSDSESDPEPDRVATGRQRWEATIEDWQARRASIHRAGIEVDAVLISAFAAALATEFPSPFSLPVVRWTEESGPFRPGEFTALSWVTQRPETPGLWAAARDIHEQFAQDRDADGVDGLGPLRRRVMQSRRDGEFDLPVVYTGVLDLAEQPLPDGVELGAWLTCTPDVALDCIAIDEGNLLRVYFDADPARFLPGVLDRVFARYRATVGSLPDRATTDLPAEPVEAGPDPDEWRLIQEWNDTDRPILDAEPIHTAFERQVRERPDAVALRWSDGTMTFAELGARANRLGWRLRALGVGPGIPVGVSVRRGPDMAVAVYGVLFAGGCYVPVEPALPADRAQVMLTDADVHVVVTSEDREGWTMPEGVTEVSAEVTGPEEPLPRLGSVADPAYVIFTSGSTGRPKGVAVTHGPLLNLVDWCARTHGFGLDDVGLCVTSLGFDLSVFDLLGLLGLGGSLYLADEAEQRDPRLLLDILLDEPITFWNSAPTTLAQLTPLFPAHRGAPGTETLRLVYLSGDYTPLTLPDEVRAVFPNATIVSLGGATEATVWSNWFEIGDIDPSWRSIPYGRPISNARYYILDEQLRPCPVGVEGGLFIGGACLSEGYYRRPELTAERFVPDPFVPRADARMYRTGDRASYYPDGNICFRGRVDHQVKIRGFRVELEEIEHRLRAASGVKDAGVLARPDPAGDKKLVAYVVTDRDDPPAVGELRAHAAAALPEYMVPNVVVFVDGYRATANGKLDRDALPWPAEPGSVHHLLAVADDGPPTEVHRLAAELAELFGGLLGVEEVGLEQDVWDLGATSFTMVQVAGALERRRGGRVPVSAMLNDPTPVGMARAVLGEPLTDSPAEPPTAQEPVGHSGAVQPPPPAPQVDFFDADQRAEFKLARHDLAASAGSEATVLLDDRPMPAARLAARSSRRAFADRPVTTAELSGLLGLAREFQLAGRSRRLYPSAGDTYAVQVFVHVRAGRVQGAPGGLYFYHPVDHALRLVGDDAGVRREHHFAYNRQLFDGCALQLFLIGQSRACAPLYPEDADRFMALEAGYLGQVLLEAQRQTGIALCPVGNVAAGPLREALHLDPDQVYLQTFVGGALADAASADGTEALTPSAQHRPVATAHHRRTDIALVGVAGQYPGAADIDELWGNLSAGVRSLRVVPPARVGQVTTSGAGTAGAAPLGGYLEDVDRFDPLLFRVAPSEAALLDPQLRLMLQAVWTCLEHAGHTAASLTRTGRVGVFLAAMWQDYQHVSAEATADGTAAGIGGTASEAVNRISHTFGFTGPSLAVDTSCSSSLAALDLAVASIRRGECESAVVAAANLMTHPHHLRLLRDLGLVAAEFPAGAYDRDRTGWSPGEGVGAVLLRSPAAAERDGDCVLAVVEAVAVGHSGSVGRYATPQPEPLAHSLTALLADAGVAPDDIDYVECAAAGAVLADLAELQALRAALAGRSEPVPFGTVKPALGHPEAAAGMAQLTKVLLQLRHGRIAPTLFAPGGVTAADCGDVLRPSAEASFWPPRVERPRRALVNAVGATGSFGHLLVREPESAVPQESRGSLEQLVPLSAADEAPLRVLAGRIAEHLRRSRRAGTAPALEDVALSLQEGRVPQRWRAVVRADDLDSLIAGLDELAGGHDAPSVLRAGAGSVGGGDLGRWLAGGEVDWSTLRSGVARRVPLPGYPFATDRYRLPQTEPSTERARPPAPAGPSDAPARGERVAALAREVTADFAAVFGIAPDRLDPAIPLADYGLSSALVVELSARLRPRHPQVTTAFLFGCATLGDVVAELADGAELADTADPAAGGEPLAAADADGEDRTQLVAVIGMAGRYPGAEDLDELWANLCAGIDSVTELPPDRRRAGWPVDRMAGGYLTDVAGFDPLFFGITPREAMSMDPQERLFLQVAWHTLEDAGYTRHRLRDGHRGRVGVFVGAMYNEYPFFGLEQGGESRPGRRRTAGSAIAGIANRVSYQLDLTGPSFTVDSMCSSSLTAVHLAVQSLRRGECAAAIVGGVNLSLHPNKFRQLDELGMSSTDHRCRSFGAGGDGFVPGEGVGAMLLKPLGAAEVDGDRILAVITGTAVNHDGRTHGYTVPSPRRQAEVIEAALGAGGRPPDSVGIVEAHGTGTRLGDPIEVDGLVRAYGRQPIGPVPLGSLKSNLGHLEAAAGIAGLTKAVLQLRHGQLVPSLHAEELNSDIDWDRVPFVVQRRLEPWPDRLPRRAGVSSFGAGGANAHVVVEEYREAAPRADTEDEGGRVAGQPVVLPLSARTREQLREVAGRLAGALRSRALSLADVAQTLQFGREALRERVALVGSDQAGLVRALDTVAAGATASGDLAGVQLLSSADAAPADLNPSLAAQWVSGRPVQWPSGGRTVSLPGYPFDRTPYWVSEAEPPTDLGRPATSDVTLYRRDWWPAPSEQPDRIGGRHRLLCVARPGQQDLVDAVGRRIDAGGFEVGWTGTEGAAVDLEQLIMHRGPMDGLLDLSALPGGDGSPEPDWAARLEWVQAVVARRPPSGVRLRLLTSGLLDYDGPPPSLAGARLAAFVRMLSAEYADVSAAVVDIERPDGVDSAAQVLVDAWVHAAGRGEVAVRGGARYEPVLRPIPAPGTAAVWRPDPTASYLVTGGTRGLGALAARHLVERGARRIALTGRRPLPPREQWAGPLPEPQRQAVATVQALEAQGARVLLSSPRHGDMAAFLAEIRSILGPLGGVICAAGRPPGAPQAFHRMTRSEIEEFLRAKPDQLTELLAATTADPLEFVVLYSSAAAALPGLGVGVSGYSAANACLDYWAAHWRRRGRPVTSVQWPVWTRGDPRAANPGAPLGLGTLDDARGLEVLDRALDPRLPPVVLVAPPTERGAFDPHDALRSSRDSASAPAASTPPGPDSRVETGTADWLVEIFSETLDLPARELDPDRPFADLGVESVLLAELATAIERRLGRPVDPSLLLERPTLRLLSDCLRTAAQDAVGRAAPHVPAAVATGSDGRVAIVGMACRFPGAEDLDAFWDLLAQGRCAVGDIPPGRWDVGRLYDPAPDAGPGRSRSRWGGFLDDLESFDHAYFGLTESEARDLDPAIRLALESATGCLSDGGYAAPELAGRAVGVFIGSRMSDYRRRVPLDGRVGLGGDQNFIAAMIAHHWDLRGPNFVVDAACASALVAVQLAVRSLRSGESRVALAGGVDVLLDERPYLEFSRAGALSPRGRCAAFSRDADGFVPGEGCGMLLLKRLDDALADGDRIHAVIDAVAVGNDGRTMGLTTPNPQAQAAVVRSALAEAGRGADEVGLLEAHGTATRIGDAIELRALSDVFEAGGAGRGACAIGSVKSNLGHLFSAAGVAGLIKAVLAVERAERPATLFCDDPNPRFDFARSPFFPASRLTPWQDEERVAGVSAFGLGGTNAHAVVSSAPEHVARRARLPTPQFSRRRLWWPAAAQEPDPPAAHLLPLTSSVFDLRFVTNGVGR